MRLKTRLLCASIMATVGAATLPAGAASAQTAASASQMVLLDIPAGPASTGLNTLATQADVQIFYPFELMAGRSVPAIKGEFARDDAIRMVAEAAGLKVVRREGDTYALEDPQGGSASDGAEGTVEALIVTAQKREEDIQDVPIAISAFTQEALDTHQIAGGPDLMTQIPNFTFTKTNFSSYSIQIRGIGTQAISATVDPAVAVAFNNTPILRNRFFEQEFYDLNRVEVLRGPQGTLYGRNATAGVVNLLPARPTDLLEARLSADVANYSSTRLEGMLNLPLVEDKVALRLAGAWTMRDGYVTNQVTGQQIDGRDLWSVRATLGFEPTDAISAYLTYEHFEEDDDRLRSAKQLCKKDLLPSEVGSVPLNPVYVDFTQGCEAASLYSDESFQTPHGESLPYFSDRLRAVGTPIKDIDPYASAIQSRDLRVIESSIEPHYQAKTDILHLQLNFDLTDAVSFTSETAFASDFVFGTQDYNRFTTTPQQFEPNRSQSYVDRGVLSEDGFFCDPQLGCSDRLLAADLATSESQQYSQEFRLSSNYDGPVNFNVGVNFLRHDAEDKYYVFINTLTMLAAAWGNLDPWNPSEAGPENSPCLTAPVAGNPDVIGNINECPQVDPNPIESLNDLGHNYFLSRNPYRLISYAAFGELYYNITPALKLTAGLRYTVDKKHAGGAPSWVLVGNSVGHPILDFVDQEWKEPTGRLVLDWQPDLGFTDETLVYASYAHGYKAGGANPPRPVLTSYGELGTSPGLLGHLEAHPRTFEPEFVDAFELGAKNTLLDGRMTFNANAFYYDYKDYQISEIVDRSAINRNFDTEVWGAELEVDWRPLENLKIGFKGGWERTRVADGEKVIDLMDRTAGDPDYIVIKPFPTIPSNCIVPVDWAADRLSARQGFGDTCLSYYTTPQAGLEDVPNNGQGIEKDLSGNELPNAPEFTTTLTVDYTLPLPHNWLMTLHADLYRQSEAWWRIINSDPYDRLEPYETVNFAAIFANEDAGWRVMAYVKNVFDKDSITGAFLNSDDTGLTTNVFLTEPRLYGLRVTKTFNGGPTTFPAFAGLGGELRLELGAGVHRTDAPNDGIWPAWVEDYPDGFQFPFGGQDEHLDVGDEREVKLTYMPKGGTWGASVGVRYGRTNGSARTEHLEQQPGGWWYGPTVIANYPQYPLADLDRYYEGPNDHAVPSVYEFEKHLLVDFAVGMEVGIGTFGGSGSSRIAAGLRYAELESTTDLDLDGTPDAYILPEAIVFNDNLRRTVYRTELTARRTFEGAGPQLSWDASRALFGNDEVGHIDVEWSLSGGVLFGKQMAHLTGEERARYFNTRIIYDVPLPESDTTTPIESSRSDRVTVPNVGASLGLSYEVSRVKISTGYRWERFYDVIDGGENEQRAADRTIDGPYLKLSLGFGG